MSLSRHEKEFQISIFDKSYKRSIYNLVPPSIQQKIDELHPKDFDLTEATLKKRIKPDPRDVQMRISFWNEYYNAQDQNRDIKVTRITDGICTSEWFYNTFLYDKNRLMYMLLPIASYKKVMDEIFFLSSEKMREIANMPLWKKDRDGNMVPDIAMCKVISQNHKRLEDRVLGSVVQKLRVDQRQENLNVNVDTKAGAFPPQNIAELEGEIKRIESEISKKRSSVDAIEVEADTLEAETIEQ